MGIVATKPSASTQARVNHAAGLPNCKPPKRNAPGNRIIANVTSDMPETWTILPNEIA